MNNIGKEISRRQKGAARCLTNELIQSGEGFAKYRIAKDEVFEGETHTITYDIYFSTDENGIWKIDRF